MRTDTKSSKRVLPNQVYRAEPVGEFRRSSLQRWANAISHEFLISLEVTMMRKQFEEYAHSHDPKYFAANASFTVVPLANTLKGRDAIGGMLRMFYHDAFSDARADLGHVTFDEEKGLGVIEFVFRGKHTGDLMGLKPTNRQVEVPMLAMYESRNNELVNARLYYDNLSFMRQLGQAP